MISMRNKKNHPSIIIKYPSYLELCSSFEASQGNGSTEGHNVCFHETHVVTPPSNNLITFNLIYFTIF